MRGRSGTAWVGLLLDRRAATAVELAIVAPFLLLIVLMIIENGLMLFGQAVLDNATYLAARDIQIGTITTSSAFETAICQYTSTYFNCSKLNFYVVSSSSAFPTPAYPLSSGTFTSPTFSAGSASDYVVAEVAYKRNYTSSWLQKLSGGLGWTMWSIAAFRNEPSS